jgi:hypothetical protein
MTIKVTWVPSPEIDVVSYDVERTDDLNVPAWTLLANIPHNLTGPNYDVGLGKFFYVDNIIDTTKFYRLTAIDLVGNRSVPSTPFQILPSGAAITNNVKLDHNYPTPGGLRYQTIGGVPIDDAVVRLFRKSDFDQGLTDTALATTRTNARGDWVSPIYVTIGFTYVVQFAKEGLYGPDLREIVV